jgi:hypothetical protein
MFARIRRVLVFLMICILPVQAMAAALVPVSCASAAGHEEHLGSQPAHAHAGPSEAHTHAYAHGDADHGSESVHGNLCCHQSASAAPSVHVLAAPQDFRVYTSSVSLLAPLYIPELPQRPPRA